MTLGNSVGTGLGDTLSVAMRRVVAGSVRQEAAPDLWRRVIEVASRLPTHTAVESADGSLSYAELVTKVTQTAQALRERGVGPGSVVGISLARGARELVTMLATLALNAAYVPLDPAHPAERLRLMCEDARPSLWVRDVDDDLPIAPDIPVWIFRQWADLPNVPSLALSSLAPPTLPRESGDFLAYVLFTSGSTGRPKGVEIGRRALESFLRSMADEPGLAPGQRLFAVAPTSFDISGLELFLPLWVGATTVIADRSTVRDPRAWAQALEDQHIDCLQATPSGWRLLLDAGWRGRPGLKMLCGGEPLTEALAKRLLEKGEQLWNLYGPTETTVWSTLTRIRSPREITVGRPIDATAIAIVGDDGSLLSADEEGEIVIGGAGLARGYRGRPDLTKAAFYHPPWAHDGARFYRTGDRGRLSADGELVCLGRRDGQVKILGHRIELSEVEAALRGSAGVNEVVVLAEHAQEKDARLVAYFQGRAGAADLLARARDTLPAYMAPARYVAVTAFPLNTNGKIDRRVLASQQHETAPVGPAPAARDWEACIAALWAEVLKRETVHVDEDVFTLGATSLLAAEMQERLQPLLGRPLPLAAVFEAPTPKALAQVIEAGATGHERIVIRLRSGPAELTPLFCLLGVTIYRGLAEALPVGRDVFALHVPTLPTATRQSRNLVEDTARHYVDALRRLRPHGPYALVGLCYGGIVAFEAARQLASMGETIESVTVLDALLPEARTIDWVARVRGHLHRLRHQRNQWLAEAWATARSALTSHALWQRLFPASAPEWAPPLDGPEADRAIASFARNRTPLAAPVLVVQARQAEQPTWARLAPDLGWSALAPQLRLLSLDTGHLDLLLRRPFVDAVARAIPLR